MAEHAAGGRQHGTPILIPDTSGSPPERLQRIAFDESGQGRYNEDWLQDLLFQVPDVLPVAEIEPIFSPLIPVCRELPTAAGPIDLLYVSPNGSITLVECKLWRNPEARRDVVGQILDYAKEISRWSYEDLSAAISKAPGHCASLYLKMKEVDATVEEPSFVDTVTRNLKRGRFLLLIVGDGIREGTENIANFLQTHGGLHFAFGLVELAVFRLPASAGNGWIAQPRVLARTLQIERTVVRLAHDSLVAEEPEQVITHKSTGRRTRISDEEFYEAVMQVDAEVAKQLPGFFQRCEEIGLAITPTGNSMILNFFDEQGDKVNLGTISKEATLDTNYVCEQTERAGDIKIGEQYLDAVASLVPGSAVVKQGRPWTWRVRKDGRAVPIAMLLAKTENWLSALEKAVTEVRAQGAQ